MPSLTSVAHITDVKPASVSFSKNLLPLTNIYCFIHFHIQILIRCNVCCDFIRIPTYSNVCFIVAGFFLLSFLFFAFFFF